MCIVFCKDFMMELAKDKRGEDIFVCKAGTEPPNF